MTQTLRRELRQVFAAILGKYGIANYDLCNELADAVEQKPRTDAIKKGNMMDAILASEANNPAHKYQEVREEFEREFDFNVLPWDGKNRAWGRLERFLFAAKQKDPDTIHRFAEKRKAEGEFSKLPSNTKIYMNPDLLIAVWPPCEDKQSSFEKKLEAAGYYD